VYAEDVTILGGRLYSIKKNSKSLVVTSKNKGLEVNVDETNYKVMFRDRNAGRSQNSYFDNSTYDRVEKLK